MKLRSDAQQILDRVKAGRFRLLRHASVRSQERGIFIEQVIHCADTCFHWRWQDDRKTHLFLGFLDKERPGGFTAVILDEVLVVTVFKRKLTKWEKNLVKSEKR